MIASALPVSSRCAKKGTVSLGFARLVPIASLEEAQILFLIYRLLTENLAWPIAKRCSGFVSS